MLASLSLAACGGSSVKSVTVPSRASRKLARYAWAVGMHGTVVVTTDGGAHWRRQNAGTTDDLACVAFADPTHGWAVGVRHGHSKHPGCVLLTTSDGGHRWTELRRLSTETVSDIACVGPDRVWAVGQAADGSGLILASSDGGATWHKQPVNLPGQTVGLVDFVDASHGWACTAGTAPNTESGRILQTSDGGAHWQVGEQPTRLHRGDRPHGSG